MKLSHPALKQHDQKAHRLLDRRAAERVPIRFQISYAGLKGARIVTGEGTLKDLSKTGCKILGVAPSSLGSSMTLVYTLRRGRPPSASPKSPSPGSTETRLPLDSPSCQQKIGGGYKT